jgi:hypothetical protein
MSAALLAEPLPASTLAADDDTLSHYFCCDPDRALCGTDLPVCDEADDDDEAVDCVVCTSLAESDVPCRAGCDIKARREKAAAQCREAGAS